MKKVNEAKKLSETAPKRGWWRFLLSWRGSRIVALALVLAALFFFRHALASLIFGNLGFGLALVLLWLGALAWVLWRRHQRHLWRYWNRWLGAAFFTLAAWAILAFFTPGGLVIGDVSFAEVSLGGSVGQNLIGARGIGLIPLLRVLAMFLVGMGLTTPHHTWRLLLGSFRAGVAMLSGIRRLLWSLATWLVRFYRRHPAPEMLAGWLRERARRPAQPPEEAPQEPLVEERTVTPPATSGQPRAGRHLPPLGLLAGKASEIRLGQVDNEERARQIEAALASYGVEARVVQVNPGPSVTQFGVEPGWDRKYKKVVERDQDGKPKLDKDGNPKVHMEEVSKTRVKVERITSLANDLALALAAPSIRIEAPVPGLPMVGLEVPNSITAVVPLREIIDSIVFQRLRGKSRLALALGKGAAGEAVAADLARMPHLLIAGATGSGKTVCLNSIITCLLMHNSPEEMRLILIDPKRVEMATFAGAPHLMAPVVVEMDQAVETLRRVTREMESRYRQMAQVGVRNIESYNRSPRVDKPMPYLVVIIDELADLMMTAAEVVEPLICRLAQLSRATGIHLVVATQRPSVDVVTGLIKANFPSRISFAVASAVDSRTILDSGGAEKLLGWGDMLYLPPDIAKPKRLRGCLVAEEEMERVVRFWGQSVATRPQAANDIAGAFASLNVTQTPAEPLLEEAKQLAQKYSRLSTSLLQRRLHIGYPRAARLMDLLEEEGILGPSEAGKSRETLLPSSKED